MFKTLYFQIFMRNENFNTIILLKFYFKHLITNLRMSKKFIKRYERTADHFLYVVLTRMISYNTNYDSQIKICFYLIK